MQLHESEYRYCAAIDKEELRAIFCGTVKQWRQKQKPIWEKRKRKTEAKQARSRDASRLVVKI
jgi:hypothetical protein